MMSASAELSEGAMKEFVNSRGTEIKNLMDEIRKAVADGKMGEAKEMMDLFDFVGISERFQESLCVFSAVVREHHHAKGPAWCNCSNTKAWASFDEDDHFRKTIQKHGHRGPSHQASDLNAKELEAIQRLTSEDDKLYKFATQRFDAQIAKYEAKGILKLSC